MTNAQLTEEDLDGMNRLQISIARAVDEWGYFGDNIKRRTRLWRGRNILEIGMGGGPHSVPFVLQGAKSYTGVDPLVGTEQVRDRRSNGNPSIPAYHAFPYTPAQIMEAFPKVRLYSGLVEEWAAALSGLDVDFVLLNAVTEHLTDTAAVMKAAYDAAGSGAVIWLAHANYYSWTGHHRPPRLVSQFNPDDPAHAEVVDWRHLEPGHACYLNSNLNRMRLDDFRTTVNKYFEIVEWREQIHARERLAPEIRDRWRRYSLAELLDRMVYVAGVRRDEQLDTDLSSLQLHHPDESYRAEEDQRGEDDARHFELCNSVYFTPKGALASHTYNDHGGRQVLNRVEPGDQLVVQKYPDRLVLTVAEVNKSENGAVWVSFEEPIATWILETSHSEWEIVGFPDSILTR